MDNIKKNNNNDLTTGPILKKIIIFFIPVAAGTLFQQLYNAVDAFVVSKYVGTTALAAVGGSPAIISSLVIGFCVALTSGCSVKIAQLYGSGEYKKMKDSIKTSFIFCTILGIVFGFLTIMLSKWMLELLGTTPEAFDLSLVYQRIYFIGTVFTLVYNMGSGILRALGNSRYPFICLFIGTCINIFLDFYFVRNLNLGVSGVAWATVISQCISSILIFVKLIITKMPYSLDFLNSKFDLIILKQMLKIGIPTGLQNSMYSISNIILQKGVNSLGTLTVASWAMTGKVDGVFWAITGAFGIAITTFVGQNYGAKDMSRIRKAKRQGLLVHFIMTIVISALIMILGIPVLNILTDDIEVIDLTYYMISWFVPFYFTWVPIEIYTAVLRGIGDTFIPSILQLIGICIFRAIWVYTVFEKLKTLEALCICYLISWVLTSLLVALYYLYVKNRKIKYKN